MDEISFVESRPTAIFSIQSPSEELQLAAVRKYPQAIDFIKNPTKKVIELAGPRTDVTNLSKLIKESLSPTLELFGKSEEQKKALIRLDPHIIQYIFPCTVDMQTIAVMIDGSAIQHCHNPSLNVCLKAVAQNPDSIRFIKKPSEHVQLFAVKHKPITIAYIVDPTEQVIALALKLDPTTSPFACRKNQS